MLLWVCVRKGDVFVLAARGWNGLKVRNFVFYCLLQDTLVGILGSTQRAALDNPSVIFSVGRRIIGFGLDRGFVCG